MRDHVFFYINDRPYEVRGEAVFSSLSEFLRDRLRFTGTKVVCAEGDCGACTVLVGSPVDAGLRYLTVDACIYFLYQLDGRHIVTIEGLKGAGGELHPVQTAMIEGHGSQCGYCTPGFVMAIAGAIEDGSRDLRTSLTGNLCRCTGYLPILESARSLDWTLAPRIAERFSATEIAERLRQRDSSAVRVISEASTFFAPRTLEDAVEYKSDVAGCVVVSGSTEVGVVRNKRGITPPSLMSLTHISGLDAIETDGDEVVIGANVTWNQLESYARDHWPEFHRIIARFGSPQIRNVATLMGNIANGSPIADSLPFLFVMDASLDIVGRQGARRVSINDFYKGYKIKDLADDEILTHVRVPSLPAGDHLRLYKTSRRNDLDIATFGAAIRVRVDGDRIAAARVAYSGVAATVVRLRRTEAFLVGEEFTETKFAEAGRVAAREIQPITDVRGSRDFRWRLAETILSKFYFDCIGPVTAAESEGTR